MQIRTLKVVEYKEVLVYIRNFGSTFEYLAFIKGQLYGAHIIVPRGFFQWALGRDYTEKQLSDITKTVMLMAEATVDYVLSQPKGHPA